MGSRLGNATRLDPSQRLLYLSQPTPAAAADARQAWRVPHSPKRGSLLRGTRPLVHMGFQRSWEEGGFKDKVRRQKGSDDLDLGQTCGACPSAHLQSRCRVASFPYPSSLLPPLWQVLGRIREILEGRQHAGMAPLGFSVAGCCCGHLDEAQKAEARGADASSGAPSSKTASAAGGTAASASAAEQGLDAAVTADVAGQARAPFRILLAGHSLGEC